MQGSSTKHARTIADATVTMTWEPTSKTWWLRASMAQSKVVVTRQVESRLEVGPQLLRDVLQGVEDALLSLSLW